MPIHSRSALVAASLFFVRSLAQLPPSANTVTAASDAVRWMGRTATTGSAVFLDWEGVSASVTLRNFTWLTVDIEDNCAGNPDVGGGSRWAVDIATSDSGVAPPRHLISTFFSLPFIRTYALLNNAGGACDPHCSFATGNATFTLTRLTESRVSGCSPAGNLSVLAFASDGVFLGPRARAPRAIEFVGDSISAGDLNDGAAADGSAPAQCGNIAINDDITKTSGARLCLPPPTGFGAECYFTAWGGVTLTGMAGRLYESTFSASGPLSAYGNWTFSANRVDAVVVNLGTNDQPAPPATRWQAEYVAFVQRAIALYGPPAPSFFLAYGPMRDSYEPFVRNVSATLTAAGVRAFPLDLTLPHAMTGCFGHPSAADNVEIAAKARPQVAAAMGWA
jgi:hypothetical protein